MVSGCASATKEKHWTGSIEDAARLFMNLRSKPRNEGVTILSCGQPKYRCRVVRNAGDANVHRVVQLRTLAYAQPGRGRRPCSGSVLEGAQGLRLIPAGNELSSLDVPHFAKYVSDVAQRAACE